MNKAALSLAIVLIVLVGATGLFYFIKGGDTRVYRIGILSGNDAFLAMADGFKQKMTELHYVEGKNVVYDFQKVSNNDRQAEKKIIEKFVADKVDLMFVFPTEPAFEAKDATEGTTIPVVFAHAGLEGNDLVKSITAPGGNLTGTRFPGPELVVKRFEYLLELVPSIKRLYVPYDKNYPNAAPALAALRPVATSRGVTLVECPVTNLAELKGCIAQREALSNVGVDAIQILPEVLTQSTDGWEVINSFAKKHNLPLVGSSDKTATIGGLFSYNVNSIEVGSMAAVIADKILHGTDPKAIPIETPEAYLHFNLTTSKKLGIIPGESFLSRVSEIIK